MPRWRIVKYYAWRWLLFEVSSTTPAALRFERRMYARAWPIHVYTFLQFGLALFCVLVLPGPWNLLVFSAVAFAIVASTIRSLVRKVPLDRRVRSLDGRCCTVCGYDLRGVPQHDSVTESGLCPECGYRFSIVETRKLFGLAS